jgi:hypothetical protein
LKPGGFVVLCVPKGGISDEEASDKLLFSGFVNTKSTKVGEFSEVCKYSPENYLNTGRDGDEGELLVVRLWWFEA